MTLIRLAIITVSDKAARGDRADLGGPAIRETLERLGVPISVVEYRVVADEQQRTIGPARRQRGGGRRGLRIGAGAREHEAVPGIGHSPPEGAVAEAVDQQKIQHLVAPIHRRSIVALPPRQPHIPPNARRPLMPKYAICECHL